MKLLLYATRNKPYLIRIGNNPRHLLSLDKNPYEIHPDTKVLNGYIVAECDFEVEEIYERVSLNDSWFNDFHHTKTMKNDELLKKSCLKFEEMNKYFDYQKNALDKVGYAIHIKNLHIFDKPRELKDFYSINEKAKELDIEEDIKEIKKAPQNMMYAFEFSKNIFERKVLISIRPEWICKILNGEKTIEIRKKVLKEML